jgi:hypothetical protein
VPFVGKNHLSASVTELSRDGVGQDRATVFGAMYGRQLTGDNAAVKLHMIVRGAARAQGPLEEGGIADGGITFAATRRVLAGLSVTGAAGVSAVVWSRELDASGEQDRSRIVARAPLSAGIAYDLKLGRATIAPFATFTGGYTNASEYVNNKRQSEDTGWRISHTAGVSLRLSEIVLSLSEVAREPGLPHRSRVAFAAGISW